MRLTRFALAIPAISLGIAACDGSPKSNPNDAACAVSVIKALELLPEGVSVDVKQIESGKSGDKLNCKVTGERVNIMIDATVTCSGGAEELGACITIDQISTLTDEVLFPPPADTQPEG